MFFLYCEYLLLYSVNYTSKSLQMDWNQVFEETGEEEGEWIENNEEDDSFTRLGYLQHLKHYSPVICYCFSVNYILGVGCLGIPYAFQKSGILQATVILIFISCVAYLTVMYVAEASFRGMQIIKDKSNTNPFQSPLISRISQQNKSSNNTRNAKNSSNTTTATVNGNGHYTSADTNVTAHSTHVNNTLILNNNTQSNTTTTSNTHINQHTPLLSGNDFSDTYNPQDGFSYASHSGGYGSYGCLLDIQDDFVIPKPLVVTSTTVGAANAVAVTNINPTAGAMKKVTIHESKNSSGTNHVNHVSNSAANHDMHTHSHSAHSQGMDDSCHGGTDSEHGSKEQEQDLTHLTHLFLGAPGKLLYQLSVLCLSYVGLLAYGQVFVSSFHSQICESCSVYLPTAIFTAIVVPLSCLDLNEQITVQIIMSLLRFVSLGLLVFGTVVSMFVTAQQQQSSQQQQVWVSSEGTTAAAAAVHALSTSDSSISSGEMVKHSLRSVTNMLTSSSLPRLAVHAPPLVNLSGFSLIFTTVIFAQLFQHAVPGLIRPLKAEHKKDVKKVFFYAIFTTTVIYLIMGILCCVHFGDTIRESINLNFVGFQWGLAPDSQYLFAAETMSMIIVLFPALDTLSVFPLIANTLGHSLHSSINLPKYLKQYFNIRYSQYKLWKLDRYGIIFFKLIAAVPPIGLSLYVKDLALSMQFAGLSGIFLALVIPTLLQITSMKMISSNRSGSSGSNGTNSTNNNGSSSNSSNSLIYNISYYITPYTLTHFSQTFVYSHIILGVAVVAFVISIGQLFGFI